MSVRSEYLARGQCPVHGTRLERQGVVNLDGDGDGRPVVGCPRRDCDFEAVPYPGSELWKTLGMKPDEPAIASNNGSPQTEFSFGREDWATGPDWDVGKGPS